jgi:hypothetical protein
MQKSITLVDEHANRLGIHPPSLINYQALESGEPSEVIVHVTDVGSVKLSFGPNSERFSISPPGLKLIVAAYGATRLLPTAAGRDSDSNRYVRIKNLFDPTSPLNDVEHWILDSSRLNREGFRHFRERLLILLPEVSDLTRDSREVRIKIDGQSLKLQDLSDGYQTLIALLGDIAITVWDYWPSLKVAEGLVLLDEIEVHLHPRWKISIVERLRQACPSMTFIVTTHDPLCLKGLRNQEIVRLHRGSAGDIRSEVNALSVTHLRWDDILSSYLFGLEYTRGSNSAVLMARYTQLLGKSARTEDEEAEFQQLERRVSDLLSPALTPVQREVEQALVKVVSASGMDPDRADIQLEMRRQIAGLLDRKRKPE